MPKLRPLGDKLLVTPYRRKNFREGPILLLENMKDVLLGDDRIFWVVAVSSKVTDIKVKDRVVLNIDHEGLELLTDGTRRGFIRASQVLAVCPCDWDSIDIRNPSLGGEP